MTNIDNKLPLNPWLRWSGIICSAFSHPFYLLISFYLLLGAGFATETSTNVFLINILPFCGILFLICLIRLWIFARMHAKAKLERNQLFDLFTRINIWSAPGLFIFVMMLMPVEGNAFGFIFIPIIFVFGIIIGPLILVKSIKSAKKHNNASS